MNSIHHFIFLSLFLLSSSIFAQGINYQAVARKANGQLMVNESVKVQFFIHELNELGPIVYEETHSISTNPYGLFSLVIGKGISIHGNFSSIDWGSSNHYLEVVVNEVNMGTTQLETVPYSKVATEMHISHLTDVQVGAVEVDEVLKWNGTHWVPGKDQVDDNDASAFNELQTLELTGNTLALTPSGGSVNLPLPKWTENGTDISFSGGSVGVGTNSPGAHFAVSGSATSEPLVRFNQSFITSSILELSGPNSFSGKFLQLDRGSNTVASINSRGDGTFRTVIAESPLSSTSSPDKGKLYANSLPVAYGYISSTGSILKNYGISSVNRVGNGIYRITLDKNITGHPVIIANSASSYALDEVITANTVGLVADEIEIYITTGDGVAKNSHFFFIVFGEIQ
ncbi:MAG: hypothetical protein AAF587_41465 [Bacteroidota bacterium]